MEKLIVLAIGEVKDAVRLARNAADIGHLKDDVFEYLNHLDAPDSTPKPDGMDISRLAMRVAKLIEHCESVEYYLKPAAEWVHGLEQAAKRQGGDV